jgi:hypothetical protein
MLDDDRDRVAFWIESGKELLLRDLLHGPFGKLLGLMEERQRVLEVRGCEAECHAFSLVRIDLPESMHRGLVSVPALKLGPIVRVSTVHAIIRVGLSL